jgi:FdhD protein
MEAPPYSAASVEVVRLPDESSARDRVAVEEPLEIRVNGRPVAVTMRTPGHDEELALGFCVSEGLAPLTAAAPDDLAANTVDVDAGAFDAARIQRNFYTSSSCGVCGKGALESVAIEASRVDSDLRVPAAVVGALPVRLREAQATFAATGGLHATGLFDAGGTLLCVSGRLSFELVQKAAVAGCPVLVAVGAPSSLAVELARDRGITLCGFVRDGRMNLYTEPWRIEA